VAQAVDTLSVSSLSVTGSLARLHLTPDRPGGLEGDVDGLVAAGAYTPRGFSAQPEPFLTQNIPLSPPSTPQHPLS